MTNGLYGNIGEKIQRWAIWLFIVEAISAVVAGIVIMINASDIDDIAYFAGILTIVLGPIAALVGSWILYGFGQLIKDVHKLATDSTIRSIDDKIQVLTNSIINEKNSKAKTEREETTNNSSVSTFPSTEHHSGDAGKFHVNYDKNTMTCAVCNFEQPIGRKTCWKCGASFKND